MGGARGPEDPYICRSCAGADFLPRLWSWIIDPPQSQVCEVFKNLHVIEFGISANLRWIVWPYLHGDFVALANLRGVLWLDRALLTLRQLSE